MISMCQYWELGGLVLSWDGYLEWSITYMVGADVLECISSQIPYHNWTIVTYHNNRITVALKTWWRWCPWQCICVSLYVSDTDIQAILKYFNALHPNLQFTAEVKRDNTLNYLDISIHKTTNNIKTSIHRKPTFTDTIFPYMSNYPTQHKYATVRLLFDRLNSYDLQEKEYQQELNVIHNILYNNSFPIKPQKQTVHIKTRQQMKNLQSASGPRSPMWETRRPTSPCSDGQT